MASPFKVFRKHQKWMIATLGLMAMIAFVFLTNIQQFSRGGGPKNPVVVTTTQYGDLRESDIQSLWRQRQSVLRFLDLLQQTVFRKGGTGRAVQAVKNILGPNPPTEQAVVDTWLCAKHAERLGLVVSNQSINGFIREISEDLVHKPELVGTSGDGSAGRGIFQQVGVGDIQMFEMLRHELLALQLRRMFEFSLYATTPAQRWDYFNRLKRRATIEVIPVPVADYAGKVQQQPSDTELQEFFEQYKENEPTPGSPEPGFRKPHRIAVAYFKAELEKFMDPDAITEEEIKKRYEENKERYDRLAAEAEKATATEEEKDEADQPEEKPEGEKEGQPPPTPLEGATEGEEGEPSTEEKTEAGEEGKEAPQDAKQPAEEQGKTTEAGTEPAKDASTEGAEDVPKPNDSDGSSSAASASPFILASLLQEEAPEEKTPEPAKPAGEKKESTDTPKQPAGEIKEPVPQPPEPAVPEPDDKRTKDDKQEAGDVQEEKPKAPWEGPVGETIRQQLAQQVANEKIKKVFDRLQAKMNKYRSSYAHYDAVREEDPSAKPPAELNFKELAEEYGLGNHATRLMSQLEAEGIDIGRSYIDVGSSDIARKWSLRFLRYAYDEGWPLHLAAKSEDVLGNHYLFWKVEDAKEEVPKFEDSGVRKQVLAAWKMVQARKLALGEAEHLRDLALKSRRALKEAFVDRPDILDKLVLTTPFSWLTRGLVPAETSLAPPRISSVTGVEMPGPDFMRTVFGLQKGQIGVAMNVPQTMAYVIRVIEFNKSDVVLWTEFTADPYMTYAAAAFDDQQRLFEAWREGLKIEAGLQWKRKADHRRLE